MVAVLPFLRGSDPVLELIRSSSARKEKAALRLRFYRDRQTDDLLTLIKQRWSKPEDLRLFCINVVRRRAMVYKATPVRTFDGWPQDAGEGLYREIGANIVLKKANRLTKLCKTTALQVGWNGVRATLAVVTPNILDAEHARDPEAPTRIVVTHPGARRRRPPNRIGRRAPIVGSTGAATC